MEARGIGKTQRATPMVKLEQAPFRVKDEPVDYEDDCAQAWSMLEGELANTQVTMTTSGNVPDSFDALTSDDVPETFREMEWAGVKIECDENEDLELHADNISRHGGGLDTTNCKDESEEFSSCNVSMATEATHQGKVEGDVQETFRVMEWAGVKIESGENEDLERDNITRHEGGLDVTSCKKECEEACNVTLVMKAHHQGKVEGQDISTVQAVPASLGWFNDNSAAASVVAQPGCSSEGSAGQETRDNSDRVLRSKTFQTGGQSKHLPENGTTAFKVEQGTPLRDDRTPLRDGRSPLRDGRTTLRDGRTPLRDGRIPLRDGRTPHTDGRTPLTDGRTPLRDDRTPITDGRTPLTDGRTPLTDGRTPLRDGREVIDLEEEDKQDGEPETGFRYFKYTFAWKRKHQDASVEPTEAMSNHESSSSPSPADVSSGTETCSRNYEGISVMKTNNADGRKYDKVAVCMICEKSQKKLPVHLRSRHASNKRVAQYLATKPGKEKDKLLALIRNKGNHIHNYKVLQEGYGELIVVYRPKSDVNPQDYLPCRSCKGWYATSDMWKHRCVEGQVSLADDTVKKRRTLLSSSRLLMPPLPSTTNETVTQEVLSALLHNETRTCIMNDDLILELAKIFCQLGHDEELHTHNIIRTKLRELSRLLLQFRCCTGNPKATLTSMISPHNFMSVIEAVKILAGYDEETHLFDTPSLAKKLGHTLTKAACVLLRKALVDREGDGMQSSVEEFLKLMDTRWKPEIYIHAKQTVSMRRGTSKKTKLSLASDVVALTRHLEEHAELCVAGLSTEDSMENEKAWSKLNEIVLTHLIVFNRRKRQSEISKMTVQDYKRIKKGESHMVAGQFAMLQEWEQNLVKVLWRVEDVGTSERGKAVPILMTECMKARVDALVTHREEAGVNPVNKYLFARCNKYSTFHIQGWHALRDLTKACRAKCPSTLRSTRSRKSVATMLQLMSLRDSEMDALANYLVNDIKFHREFYRLPDAAVQVAKIHKILLAMNGNPSNNLVKLMGTAKSLDDLQLDSDEEFDIGNQEPESGEEESAFDPDDRNDAKEHDDEQQLQGRSQRGCDIGKQEPESGEKESAFDPDDRTVRDPNEHDQEKQLQGSSQRGSKRRQSLHLGEPDDQLRKKTQKKIWSDREKAAVHRHLGAFMTVGSRLPRKNDIERCLAEPALKSRTWRNIKDFIRNTQARLLSDL